MQGGARAHCAARGEPQGGFVVHDCALPSDKAAVLTDGIEQAITAQGALGPCPCPCATAGRCHQSYALSNGTMRMLSSKSR